MRIVKYFFTHSFFVAWIAAMLTWLSFYQFQLPLEPAIIGLIFFLVLSAYNVYWMIWMLLTDKKNKQIFTLSRYAARLVLIFLSGVAILDIVWYRPFLLQLLWWPSIFLLLYFFISFKIKSVKFHIFIIKKKFYFHNEIYFIFNLSYF